MPDDTNIPNELGPDDSSSPDTRADAPNSSADDDASIPADDIEAELRKLQSADDQQAEQAAADALQAAAGEQTPDDVEAAMQALLEAEEQVQQAMPDDTASASPATSPSASRNASASVAVTPAPLPDLSPSRTTEGFGGISLLDDVELDLKIELGRTGMYIEDVLHLGVGSVVELDKLAGDPVDVYINERLVARGEVLVLNNNFCVRVNEIISPVPELEVEA